MHLTSEDKISFTATLGEGKDPLSISLFLRLSDAASNGALNRPEQKKDALSRTGL
jgi:hypothetical protein